jgi:hypothetical protein
MSTLTDQNSKIQYLRKSAVLQTSLENRHSNNSIASLNLNNNSNTFRAFIRKLFSIYKQKNEQF